MSCAFYLMFFALPTCICSLLGALFLSLIYPLYHMLVGRVCPLFLFGFVVFLWLSARALMLAAQKVVGSIPREQAYKKNV